MKKKYSVAIHPSEDIILLVKEMKKKLFDEVNWFHSKNSIAHITICEFEATDDEIEIIKNKSCLFIYSSSGNYEKRTKLIS